MANLARSAKSGSDWSSSDLSAYNITVSAQPAHEFFGQQPNDGLQNLDQCFVSASLEDDPSDRHDLPDNTLRLLQYLDLATRANVGQESAIDDLAKELLRVLGYEERGTLLRSRCIIPLEICGDSGRQAQTGVCLVHPSTTILLLLTEDKTAFSGRNPEPQIIAEAIAAFQYNNNARESVSLPRIDEMVFPCITMIGTRPTFHKIPVTTQLSSAVAAGTYPEQTTQVVKCLVPSRRASEGMEIPIYRRNALQYLVAFRDLARPLWKRYYV